MRLVPESFHPGEYIREEMEARGWTLKQLAHQLNVRYSVLRDDLLPNCVITPRFAEKLGEIFKTGSAIWLNLQAIYDLTVMIERKQKKRERTEEVCDE